MDTGVVCRPPSVCESDVLDGLQVRPLLLSAVLDLDRHFV